MNCSVNLHMIFLGISINFDIRQKRYSPMHSTDAHVATNVDTYTVKHVTTDATAHTAYTYTPAYTRKTYSVRLRVHAR